MSQITRQEKLRLFAEEIFVAAKIGMWCFAQDTKKLLYSTSPNEEEMYFLLKEFINLDIFMQPEGFDKPIILTDENGLFWVAEHFYEEKPVLLLLMGPIFIKHSSKSAIKEKAYRFNLNFDQRRKMQDAIEEIPIMQMSMFHQYCAMFHYTIREEYIQPKDFLFYAKESNQLQKYENKIYCDFEARHRAEESILQAIRDGNLGFLEVIDEKGDFGGEFVSDSGNLLRDAKNTLIVLCSLATRTAIDSGLSIQNAKEAENFYINQIEFCTTMGELISLNIKMLRDFTSRIHQIKKFATASSAIQNVIDDIHTNIYSPITTKSLAKKVGYTDYYLSKKFHLETGIKLTDYIKYAKIEKAKSLLCTSKLSIQEISEQLNFNTRNYFTRVFKELTGSSPAVYREENKSGNTPLK